MTTSNTTQLRCFHLTETGFNAGRVYCDNARNDADGYVHAVYADQLNPALFSLCGDCVAEIRDNSDDPDFAAELSSRFVITSEDSDQDDDESAEEDEQDPEYDVPGEDDGYIADNTRGGYDVSWSNKFVGNFADRDDAEAKLQELITRDGYFPNCWFVDDHGGHQLITFDSKN